MKTKVVQLHDISPEEFKNQILKGVDDRLDSLLTNLQKEKTPEYLTRKEVASLLGVSLVTIHDWCKKEILNPYRIGNRVRFKKEEIESTLENSRRK